MSALDPNLPVHVGIAFGRFPAVAIGQKQLEVRRFIPHEFTTINTSVLTFGKAVKTRAEALFDLFKLIT